LIAIDASGNYMTDINYMQYVFRGYKKELKAFSIDYINRLLMSKEREEAYSYAPLLYISRWERVRPFPNIMRSRRHF